MLIKKKVHDYVIQCPPAQDCWLYIYIFFRYFRWPCVCLFIEEESNLLLTEIVDVVLTNVFSGKWRAKISTVTRTQHDHEISKAEPVTDLCSKMSAKSEVAVSAHEKTWGARESICLNSVWRCAHLFFSLRREISWAWRRMCFSRRFVNNEYSSNWISRRLVWFSTCRLIKKWKWSLTQYVCRWMRIVVRDEFLKRTLWDKQCHRTHYKSHHLLSLIS